MTMAEIVNQIAFSLGMPAVKNIEQQQLEQAVTIAFRELKRYIDTPVDKTVPFSTRIHLQSNGIYTKDVLYIYASRPRIGLTLGTIDSGNVFQVAAAVNTYSAIGQTSSLNIDPIMTEMAMAQVRNTLSTDFQWKHDINNDIVYCTHRDPRPAAVTIRYVPDYQDVSEIKSPEWIDYLIRLSEAYMKRSLGRARSKYTIEGSNVTLDGATLLDEATAEFEKLREELAQRKNNFVVLN